MKTSRWAITALWCLFLSACGGEEEEPPVTRAPRPAVRAADSAAGAQAASAFDSTQLLREVFSYRGAGRDPFASLLRSASMRPLVQDVRVAGITFDPQYPARSVAVLRIQEIRPDAVVVTLDEFGTQRQVILAMKRREAPNP